MYNHQLDTFLSVCEHGSFTMAAKKSFITPSAVVQQINLLEKNLGVKLFDRKTRGVTLTTAGEILKQHAPDLIRHALNIEEAMKKAANHRPIRLGWSTGVEDPRFLSECLKLRDTHEGLEINLTSISGSVLQGLSKQEFDLCQYVASPVVAEAGYDFTPLYTVQQCVVLPPAHPLNHLNSIDLPDLCGYPLVVLAPGILTDHDAFRKLVKDSGLPIQLMEVPDYGFETKALCYNKQLPFLGMMPLCHEYQPLTCLPARWEVPVQVGLMSIKPQWADLTMLLQEITRRLSNSPTYTQP